MWVTMPWKEEGGNSDPPSDKDGKPQRGVDMEYERGSWLFVGLAGPCEGSQEDEAGIPPRLVFAEETSSLVQC